MAELDIGEYVKALEKMKNSSRDRAGILSELAGTGAGVGAGVAVSSTVASLAGATTIAGSATLGSLLGGIFVAATPVGWAVGAAFVGGCVGYILSRLGRDGGLQDARKEKLIKSLEQKIALKRAAANNTTVFDDKQEQLISTIQAMVVSKTLSQARGTGLLIAVERGHTSVEHAFDLVQELLSKSKRSQ